MSKSAFTVKAYGFYLLVLGVILILAPNIFQATVYTRAFALVAFAAFAILGLASPVLVLFGAVDFAGGIWTHLTLKAERQA